MKYYLKIYLQINILREGNAPEKYHIPISRDPEILFSEGFNQFEFIKKIFFSDVINSFPKLMLFIQFIIFSQLEKR